MSQSKDKAQCHSNQTNGYRALKGQTGVDTSGPIRSYECNSMWNSPILSLFSTLRALRVAVTLASLSPSLSLLHRLPNSSS